MSRRCWAASRRLSSSDCMSDQRGDRDEHKRRAYGERASDARPDMALPCLNLIGRLINHRRLARNTCPIAWTSRSAALNVDRVMFCLLLGFAPHATRRVTLGMEA